MTIGNRIFADSQRQLLNAVLNRIVPAQGDRPGAGDLGIAAFVEQAAAKTPGLTRMFNEGLNTILVAASKSQPGGFLAMADAEQDDTLLQVESSSPEFFDQLVQQAYNGYYISAQVFDAIGYDRSGAPGEGAQPALMDESLLETQRRREPFWRRT